MMPRTRLPPTPVSSTELIGEDNARVATLERPFNLPPPAIAAPGSHRASSTTPAFSLPPPPTRSRTIIQMKPKPLLAGQSTNNSVQAEPGLTNKKATHGPATQQNASRKKQPSSTSVAGKKIARKTAHSVIERRRRSKMNEEFGLLKSMIPACHDQEMHKLAILQVISLASTYPLRSHIVAGRH